MPREASLASSPPRPRSESGAPPGTSLVLLDARRRAVCDNRLPSACAPASARATRPLGAPGSSSPRPRGARPPRAATRRRSAPPAPPCRARSPTFVAPPVFRASSADRATRRRPPRCAPGGRARALGWSRRAVHRAPPCPPVCARRRFRAARGPAPRAASPRAPACASRRPCAAPSPADGALLDRDVVELEASTRSSLSRAIYSTGCSSPRRARRSDSPPVDLLARRRHQRRLLARGRRRLTSSALVHVPSASRATICEPRLSFCSASAVAPVSSDTSDRRASVRAPPCPWRRARSSTRDARW